MIRTLIICFFTFYAPSMLVAQTDLDHCERLKKASNWDSLIQEAQAAWGRYKVSDGEMSPYTIRAVGYLGNAFWNTNQRDTAIAYQTLYCNLLYRSLGDTSLQVVREHRLLGNFHLQHDSASMAKPAFDIALSIAERNPVQDSSLLGYVLNSYGYYYYITSDYNKALATHFRALFIREALQKPLQIAQTYNNIGICYTEKGAYYEAIRYHEMALDIRKRDLPPMHSDIGQSYQNLSNCYYYLEDYEYAKEISETALSMYLAGGEVFTNSVAQLYGNLGNIYAEMGQYEKANDYINKAITVQRGLGEELTSEMARLFDNLGNNDYHQKKYTVARSNYQKALDILDKLPDEEQSPKPRILMNLGNALHDNGEYLDALGYYQRAMDIYSEKYELLHHFRLYCTMNEANSYKKLNNFGKAHAMLDTVEYALTQAKPSFQKSKSTILMIDLLADRADIYWHQYLKDSTLANAQKALAILRQAIDTLLVAKEELRWESSKTALYKDFRHLFEEGIAISRALYERTDLIQYRNSMFELAELSKAIILNDAVRKAHFTSLHNVPDTLLSKITAVDAQLAKFQQQSDLEYQADLDNRDHEILGILGESIIQKKAERLQLQQEVQAYTGILEIEKPMPLHEVRRRLKPDQCILEFYMGEKTKYLFLIRKDTCIVQTIAAQIPISDWVNKLRMGLMFPDGDEVSNLSPDGSLTAYIESASILYTALIAPVKQWLRKEVTIIPDGILHYVPFEALLQSLPSDYSNFRTFPYLLEDHALSYSFNCSLHFSMSDKSQKNINNPVFGFFAPFYKHKCSSFDELKHSNNEKIKLGSSNPIRAMVFAGDTCTDALFVKKAPQFDVLHISTHGSFSDLSGDHTFMVFANCDSGRLFPRHIYAIPLKASLVFLNGCQTNRGQLLEGEGIIGLCRAFAHAGAASVIANDWEVKDHSASQISNAFYAKVFAEKAPSTKAAALQAAKLQFLRDDQNSTLQHPHYWIGARIWGHQGKFHEK